ncbi:leiomodin-3 [Platysternon megacephalum]|uniref:Leiomodin-3 n=1 Tax=Platysternon megacephalum TaxID=55544 RepID=A0A4D9EUK5_9SAUR|nr:leiomodin-3 [Platysternon megacephalum]
MVPISYGLCRTIQPAEAPSTSPPPSPSPFICREHVLQGVSLLLCWQKRVEEAQQFLQRAGQEVVSDSLSLSGLAVELPSTGVLLTPSPTEEVDGLMRLQVLSILNDQANALNTHTNHVLIIHPK